MKKIRDIGLMLGGVGVAAVLTLTASVPASASTINGRSCYPHRFGIGDWRAMKSVDGGTPSVGKPRFTKTGAATDCRRFVVGL